MKHILQYYVVPFLIGLFTISVGMCVIYLLFAHYVFRLIVLGIFGGLSVAVGLWMTGILILGIVGYDFLVSHDEGFKREEYKE